MNNVPDPISILLVGQTTTCKEIRQALNTSKLSHEVVAEANDCEQAKTVLAERPVTVVMCEIEIEGGTWQSLLEHTQATATRPSVVVCGRLADSKLLSKVLNLGGHDVLLCEPVVYDELIRVVEAAHRHCPLIKASS